MVCSGAANSGDVDSASGQQVPLPESAVPGAGFFGGQFLDVCETGGGEPVCELSGGVVVLILRCPPVPGVADAIFVAGVSTEADDFIECAIDQGGTAEYGTEVAEWQEDRCGQSCSDSAKCGVDDFLPPLIAAVEPDGQPTTGSNESGDGLEDGLGTGVMMHDTDGENEVERIFREWQLFEIGLQEAGIGEVSAEFCGFVDGAGVIGGGDECTGGSAEERVASAAAACVEYREAAE